ncbi:hypothetical protein LZG04_27910 [Saccharothrix sp. S26]|uniref:pPIWI_RE_Z domain-containing protein n=1 Tax=Saccharothrix sp. S26 TaxID=2907215 RepID=UPI001F2F10F3|nr:hypothetical protein [Saccharothrix sp. S26]MCE6998596.1 hypothetical protein [Saccharothrix sp. S26]
MRSSRRIFQAMTAPLSTAYRIPGDALHKAFTTELGLFAAQTVLPGRPAIEAWPLFSGFPFARERGIAGFDETLRTVRYELWTMRSPAAWRSALADYNEVEEELRGYRLIDPSRPPARRPVSTAPERWPIYERLLRAAAPFASSELRVAGPGPHTFIAGEDMTTVTLPALDHRRPVGHDLDEPQRGAGKSITIDKSALLVTARDMDATAYADWEGRLDRVALMPLAGERFAEDGTLDLDGLTHLLGIVGAGKSTLRDVLTVHAVAKLGLRVTLVVGDVAEALKLVELFGTHGVRAAPVIGASTRVRHAERLHRRLAGRGAPGVLGHVDAGFDHLSTSCALAALRGDDRPPLAYHDAPCTSLRPKSVKARAEARRACPFWSACPRHHSARELVEADVWVATPQSLVLTAVPWPQNAERIRFMELACRRSDIVVVDEVDRVQITLDSQFAPMATLVGRGAVSWLDKVHAHKIGQLVDRARIPLSDNDVQMWSAAVNTACAATDRIYALLVRDHDLRQWLRAGHFSAWLLHRRLAADRYPRGSDSVPDPFEAARAALLEELDRFRDNPFGERRSFPPANPSLVRLTSELLHATSLRRTRLELRDVLAELTGVTKDRTGREWLDQWATRFEFTLLLAALEPKLALMTVMWPRVEAALNLDAALGFRVPDDYGPVIPEPPMGDVIGFQFLPEGRDDGGVVSGELKFFHCTGVGRDLLKAMADLPEADNRPGPHVVLLSGSSWAGSSSRYHVDVPVRALLAPDRAEIERIASHSDFRFAPVRDGKTPLRVSGTPLDGRSRALTGIVTRLAASTDEHASVLEDELADIADDYRRRILLLVGSYDEAELVADLLHGKKRWRDKVFRLVPDDAEIAEPGEHQAPVLRRGDVDTLAMTRADILVAPLLAVERGHNILNEQRVAAIGSVFFLVRPSPRPDDLALAVHAVNDWASRVRRDGRFRAMVSSAGSLDEAGRAFRSAARAQWRRVVGRSMAWRDLGDDRESVTWDLLVVIWQVIGRLVRGGVPARVVFVDAAFAPNLALGHEDTAETSLLVSMHAVLDRYCSPDVDPAIPGPERQLVRELYGPLWSALGMCLANATGGMRNP